MADNNGGSGNNNGSMNIFDFMALTIFGLSVIYIINSMGI